MFGQRVIASTDVLPTDENLRHRGAVYLGGQLLVDGHAVAFRVDDYLAVRHIVLVEEGLRLGAVLARVHCEDDHVRGGNQLVHVLSRRQSGDGRHCAGG